MKSRNERVVTSRNQREGKFIPGWCINPAYKKGSNPLVPSSMKVKTRAGRDYALSELEHSVLGKVYVRDLRTGAFE